MFNNFSKQSIKKQVLLSLGIVMIGSSAIFDSATQDIVGIIFQIITIVFIDRSA
jgi:hypothetical protein